ncbi:MltG/YceG/YrrL family protein [Oceanobacillus damuensis]|uniref:hypothetical protein n=1 Tax=Oceanobacillus damuensis TaxID=937928 RepID=UPI000831F5AA|nr:hypothetical protein [Oceanobacillus damuensis]
MKYTVRSFSVGLLTSAVIMLIVFYLVGNQAQSAADMKSEEMIPLLESKGYTVLTKEEYIALSVSKEVDSEENSDETDLSEKEEAEEATNSTEDAEEENETRTTEEENGDDPEETEPAGNGESNNSPESYTLTINPGMASSDISSLLAENNIIENASEFNNYLDEHDYSLKVQIGTYELTSDMSFYQIAEKISN